MSVPSCLVFRYQNVKFTGSPVYSEPYFFAASSRADNFVVLLDSVSEVLRFEKTLIEAPPDTLSNGVDSDYVEGVGKLNDGKRMILILDISKILTLC